MISGMLHHDHSTQSWAPKEDNHLLLATDNLMKSISSHETAGLSAYYSWKNNKLLNIDPSKKSIMHAKIGQVINMARKIEAKKINEKISKNMSEEAQPHQEKIKDKIYQGRYDKII